MPSSRAYRKRKKKDAEGFRRKVRRRVRAALRKGGEVQDRRTPHTRKDKRLKEELDTLKE